MDVEEGLFVSDAENTIRALKGEPLLSTKLGCRIGWHKWEKYKEPKTMKEGVYSTTYQSRNCAHCNLLEMKILRKEYS